jgi:hypothetical protein
VRFWNVGRAAKNVVRSGLIRWRCPAAQDDRIANDRLDDLRPLFEGKTVALVGNAQSLFGGGLGPEIESAAVVARMNFGFVSSSNDQGWRTDALFFATKMSHSKALELFGCSRFIWSSPKRDTIALGFLLRPQSIAFVPLEDARRLEAQLNARPSTGLVALHLLLNRMGAAQVRLYGFDWKATKTFYETTIFRNVHAWENERDLVLSWVAALGDRLVIRSGDTAD